MSRYDEIPGHPLCGVPDQVLDAARQATQEAVEYGDLDAEHSEPIADSVVLKILLAGYRFTPDETLDLVDEWLTLWADDDNQPGKLPNALQVRSAVALAAAGRRPSYMARPG